jgi:Xaa-Pro aminopeptidase
MPKQPSEPPITLLRRAMASRRLDAFIVPRADEHQGEYVPPSAQRLAWLTGFTGSAGAAVVMADKAAIFVDGRYTLQVAAEVDHRLFDTLHLIENPPFRWLAETLAKGDRLGYDPWLHTPDQVENLRQACLTAGAVLVAVNKNPVDVAWKDRPAPPVTPVVPQPITFAGQSAAAKRAMIAGELTSKQTDAVLLASPESIAWLLNIRGNDVDFTPLPLSFALLHQDASVDLFIDPRKISPETEAHLGPEVRLHPPQDLASALAGMGGRKVRLDPAGAPAWALQRLTAARAKIERAADPCLLPRACKNPVELEGARNAHLRDGLALSRFLAWLAKAALSGEVTESIASDRLESFRRDGNLYQGPSFATIAGAGPNGAIVHYRSTPATNRPLTPGQIFLIDSGGQYLDGTTDVTRTVAVGEPGAEERHRFTLVLKGHIAVATARFPKGTSGAQLDSLARQPLWAEGLDYDHGTGHGVGSYLSVHEGPQRIAKNNNSQPLLPGMMLSDEPGYYKTGAYGIRIENLVVVQEDPRAGERPTLGFEVLTLAPIDLSLIDRSLLNDDEAGWLNAYHRRVRESLTPMMDPVTAGWLEQATRAI